jgi:hypothetical protein
MYNYLLDNTFYEFNKMMTIGIEIIRHDIFI